MPTVVLAPDKFKGSLTAQEVSSALARGLRRGGKGLDIVVVPVADGGDGTLAAALAAGFSRVPVVATGPTGEAVHTAYARSGDVAVVELAGASGLVALPGGRTAPLTATSRGTGEVVAAALADGCTEIVLGVGGSACTDGGTGLVSALGARLRDVDGRELGDGGAELSRLVTLDLTALESALTGVRVILASDVDNPLTGPTGAATVYAPQKGASSAQVGILDAALAHWADVVAQSTGEDLRDVPGSGAAGGVGFAALALLGAERRPGIDVVIDLVHLPERLAGADLVVTGEGSLDEQTLAGKAPLGVAREAGRAGVPVVAVCGRSSLDPALLRRSGFSATYALTDLEPDVDRCMAEADRLLEAVGETLAREWVASGTPDPDPGQPR